MNLNKKRFVYSMFAFLVIFSFSFLVSATYTQAYYSSGSSSPISTLQGGIGAAFSPSQCQAGQDFALQIAPLSCMPVPVRSDLLSRQNVDVFCQISATQINPLINVNAINSISITGSYPKGVVGVGYFPAQAALGQVGASINTVNQPVLSNFGYAVITLKQQPNESAQPAFVEGNLTARISYNVQNAFGVGQAQFYLPVLSDSSFQDQINNYAFWNGRGFLRAENVQDGSATIGVYEDNSYGNPNPTSTSKSKLTSVTLKPGQTSNQIYMPGFNFCQGGMKLTLNDVEAPDTTAILNVNGDYTQIKKGEKFLNNNCQVTSLGKSGTSDNQGLVQDATISCSTDNGGKTFKLGIYPKIDLNINGVEGSYSIGDKLYSIDGQTSAYLADIVLATPALDPMAPGNLEIKIVPYKSTQAQISNDITFMKTLTQASESFSITEGKPQKVPSYLGGKTIGVTGYSKTGSVTLAGDQETNYKNAMSDYETVISTYSGETDPTQPTSQQTLGETAFRNAISLASGMKQNSDLLSLCSTFKQDFSNLQQPSECTDAYLQSNTEFSSSSIVINGKVYDISFEGISEPSYQDYGAQIGVKDSSGKITEIDLSKNELKYLPNSNQYIQLISVGTDSVQLNVGTKTTGGITGTANQFVNSITTRTLSINKPQTFGSSYTFNLDKINLNKVAKVSVNPEINYAPTTATFPFKIGIEQRSIQLTPTKINESLKKVNKTIQTLQNIQNNLKPIVSNWQTACQVTGGALMIKNFLADLSGSGIARQAIMTAPNVGWDAVCQQKVKNGEFSSIDACLIKNNNEINKDVTDYQFQLNSINSQMKSLQQGITQTSFLGESVVDTQALKQKYMTDSYKSNLISSLGGSFGGATKIGNQQVKISDIVNSMTSDNVQLSQAEDLQLNSQILSNTSISSTLRAIAKAQIQSDLGSIWSVTQQDAQLKDASTAAANTLGIPNLDFTNIQSKNTVEAPCHMVKTSKVSIDIPAGVDICPIVFQNEQLIVSVEPAGNIYTIKDIYSMSGHKIDTTAPGTGSTFYNTLKRSVTLVKSDSYNYPYQNPTVQYYETAPYKGIPAIVPFDLNNGWYVAVQSALPLNSFSNTVGASNNLGTVDQSGRVSIFWICNVGPNGQEEGINVGDDSCTEFYPSSGQAPAIHGLSESQSLALAQKAQNALVDAQKGYSAGVSYVTILGQKMKVGPPATSTPGLQCEDIMSPSDCNILFNVCDPVVCPASRCNLGGKYPVQDVVQSGISGSLALCYPNAKWLGGTDYVPFCLTGVQAGLQSITSVFKSYRDCLTTAQKTGQYVGICDEITGVYECQVLWQQGLPLLKIAGSSLLGKVTGQGTSGGGEYLGLQNALSNVKASTNYITNYYASDSYKAVKARSILSTNASDICKNFASLVYPQLGAAFNSLANPDSPPQYYGNFQEIPYTTATNPPISQYKVFYQIYAGNNSNAYYQVYLKAAGSSFYQDTSLNRIVATGFIQAGSYASNTSDFTAPSGYQQLCISVNGQENCGFKEVTTEFGANYLSDLYKQQQATQNITSEAGCISGTPIIGGTPTAAAVSAAQSIVQSGGNVQAAGQNAINPSIYNQGITRICSNQDPGVGSDPNAGTVNARWVKVGYCGNPNMGCWLDTKSVVNTIQGLGIQNQTLKDLQSNALSQLEASGNYLTDTQFQSLISNIQNSKPQDVISLVAQNINNVIFNNQKGYLFLLRGDAYTKLAESLFTTSPPSTTVTSSGISSSGGTASVVNNMGPTSDVTTMSQLINQIETQPQRFQLSSTSINALNSGNTATPVFSFNGVYYFYSQNQGWFWSEDKSNWIPCSDLGSITQSSSSTTTTTSNNPVPTTVPADVTAITTAVGQYQGKSTDTQNLIKALHNDNYGDGISALMQAVENSKAPSVSLPLIGQIQVPFTSTPDLTTNSVTFENSGIFTIDFGSSPCFNVGGSPLNINPNGCTVYLQVGGPTGWEWSPDKSEWMPTSITAVSGGNGNYDGALIDSNSNFFKVVGCLNQKTCQIPDLFSIGTSSNFLSTLIPSASGSTSGISLSCTSATSCQQVLGHEIEQIAQAQDKGYDTKVQQDTGAKSFSCLVLQIAYLESGVEQCYPISQNNNPLYCNNQYPNTLKSTTDTSSYGVMQINTQVHSVDAADFETNVNTGIQLLVSGYSLTPEQYTCNSKTYSGWAAALRHYNGWNTNPNCNAGNVNYVEDVENVKNNPTFQSLFPECV